MKKLFVICLLLLFCFCTGCKKTKKEVISNTTAAAGEEAGKKVEVSETSAPSSEPAPSKTQGNASSGSSAQTETPAAGTAETAVSGDAQAPSAGTLSKEDIGALLTAANNLTVGWLNIGIEAKAHFDRSDTFEMSVEEYSLPYIRVSGAAYDSVEALQTAVKQTYTAEAASVFDGFILSSYAMHDGKLYASDSIGQTEENGGLRASFRLLSQSAEECRLQVNYICDPAIGDPPDGYQAGDTVRSEDLTLRKEDGQWKFTSPVSIFGLYYNWFRLAWED